MKVALINYCPPNTGIGRYTITLCKFLRNCGIKVDHYFMNKSDWCLYRNPGEEPEPIYKVKKNPLFDNFIFSKLYLSNLLLDYRLARVIPRDYDIFHITGSRISNINLYLRLSPSVVTVHDVLYRTYPRDYRYKILDRLIERGVKRSDLIITDVSAAKSDVIRYYHITEEKIRVIHLGIENCFTPLTPQDVANIYSRYGLATDCRYILHVGKGPSRDISTLIKAFHRLITDFDLDNIKLIKINKMDPESEKELQRANLQDHVKIIDYVPEEDLVKFYNIAGVFVFPSFFEGFGFPALEAMACGTPVITTNVPSLPEVLGNAAIMLETGDVSGFVQAMYKVLTDDGLRQELISRGLGRAKQFSWEKTAEDTLKVYTELVKSEK